MKENKATKSSIFEMMYKINPIINERAKSPMENEYNDKAKKIKYAIDGLIIDQEYDAIDTLYKLLVGKKK